MSASGHFRFNQIAETICSSKSKLTIKSNHLRSHRHHTKLYTTHKYLSHIVEKHNANDFPWAVVLSVAVEKMFLAVASIEIVIIYCLEQQQQRRLWQSNFNFKLIRNFIVSIHKVYTDDMVSIKIGRKITSKHERQTNAIYVKIPKIRKRNTSGCV